MTDTRMAGAEEKPDLVRYLAAYAAPACLQRPTDGRDLLRPASWDRTVEAESR